MSGIYLPTGERVKKNNRPVFQNGGYFLLQGENLKVKNDDSSVEEDYSIDLSSLLEQGICACSFDSIFVNYSFSSEDSKNVIPFLSFQDFRCFHNGNKYLYNETIFTLPKAKEGRDSQSLEQRIHTCYFQDNTITLATDLVKIIPNINIDYFEIHGHIINYENLLFMSLV